MRLLCIGDSNTWGYDARSYFGERYPASERWVNLLAGLTGCECVNLGENGRCIPKTPLDVELSEDERVVVMLGSNDLLEGFDAAACAGRMERFVAPCRGGSVLIVAPAPFERGSWWTATRWFSPHADSHGSTAESRSGWDSPSPTPQTGEWSSASTGCTLRRKATAPSPRDWPGPSWTNSWDKRRQNRMTELY